MYLCRKRQHCGTAWRYIADYFAVKKLLKGKAGIFAGYRLRICRGNFTASQRLGNALNDILATYNIKAVGSSVVLFVGYTQVKSMSAQFCEVMCCGGHVNEVNGHAHSVGVTYNGDLDISCNARAAYRCGLVLHIRELYLSCAKVFRAILIDGIVDNGVHLLSLLTR